MLWLHQQYSERLCLARSVWQDLRGNSLPRGSVMNGGEISALTAYARAKLRCASQKRGKPRQKKRSADGGNSHRDASDGAFQTAFGKSLGRPLSVGDCAECQSTRKRMHDPGPSEEPRAQHRTDH